MLSNYLKVLFRGLVRNKLFSLINLLGLSAGITSALLITLYVVDEFAFERHHANLDRIHLVTIEATWNGQTSRWTGVPNQVGPTIAKEIPEVERAVRLFSHEFGNLAFVSTDRVKSSEKSFGWGDPEVFEVLSYRFLQGDPSTSLQRPNTAVMSESAARKYFGTTDVIGKTFTVDKFAPLEVTGVYADPPATSRFQYPIIGSFPSHYFGQEKNQSWGNASFETYLLLRPGADPAIVETKIDEMLARHIAKDERWFTLHLKPLKDLYIYLGDVQDFYNPIERRGDIGQLRILMALGLVVILIAAFNYMNLSTAQSQRRFKEIGVSKSLGATSQQLARKFYVETAVFVLIALAVSILVTGLSLPIFNAVTGKAITASFLMQPWFWASFVAGWLLLSLLAGIYPAFYLSSFSPKRVLKSVPEAGGGLTLRKGLVVLQFTASVVLIVCTFALYRQLNFMRNQKLGYAPEQVIAVRTTGADSREQILSLKAALEQLPDVNLTSRSQSFPGSSASGRSIPPLSGEGEGMSIKTVRADHRVTDVLGMRMLAGTGLPEVKAEQDTTVQVVVNQVITDFLGLSPEEAVKRVVQIHGFGRVEIVGVVDNFHHASLKEAIGGYVYHNARTEGYNYLLVNVKTDHLTETMRTLEETYKSVVPTAFEYTFLEQRLATLYRSEEQMAQIIFFFAGLAIFVACLGLYALAAYTTERRTREIGIRKTLGASELQLSNLLSREFLVLVAVSVLVAMPVGYYVVQWWLEGFAYKVQLGVVVFAGAGVLALAIAWFTVGLESWKAARMNPVNALRSE
ncbi:MAG: ABC transporter permease [Cyclobacteriaceae bacterium]|nr:ABC transporter permease [Cyclobacteriaceae bacterium]